ncbi:hypothetical protein EM6_0823 [Asticcacaulis excentricus]|uniref:Uncharacterized protein n=1 Tax=Asticcacaulis excentricus TaxID=78587 RepID=A0A3G9G5I8_9CAUL|nr:hypothetical protein EM6_0823 [Asticcacaulis excentricus]
MINVSLFALVVIFSGNKPFSTAVAVAALALSAVYCFWQALKATFHNLFDLHPFQSLLIWVPGASALTLASRALWFAKEHEPFSLPFSLLMFFYGLQLAWLTISGAELKAVEGRLPEFFEKT